MNEKELTQSATAKVYFHLFSITLVFLKSHFSVVTENMQH